MLKDIFINCKQWHFENDETCGGCKMLAKNHKIMKNTQNIKNDYTKYSNIKLGQTQYIVSEIELEQLEKSRKSPYIKALRDVEKTKWSANGV